MSGSEIMFVSAVQRGFSKASFAVDTNTKMILACDCVDSNHADVKRITYLIDDLAGSEFSISYVVADKGYDAEYVHKEIWERLDAKTMIPIRNMSKPSKGDTSKKARGFNRRLMGCNFDKTAYNRRPLVETVNSMIKRKMGDVVYGKNEASRHKEVLFRCIAHNIRRLMDLGCVIL